ncbi:hypothetical protein AKJ44_02775 [candidate division MSBL1 archaeon SCGC-AAA261F17]|uniref:Peptidase S49 domain-containing protein n=1 Tax=candidate division MSBL1 archaeon SCGC-AAA261F17 TaxID=1698274 RepID=A0A133V456_9EURY|nr:hypothetical protein AKJ44_02775 [candidate division MSBL1 archaeon SCGC-AAA261F17]
MSKSIALIPVKGPITSGSQALVPILGSWNTPERTSKMIERAEDEDVDGVIFEIDSPGGTPYPSKELAQKVKELKIPTVACIKENGLSGAYWIASSCDKIVADELSKVGGLGVAAVRLDFSEFFKKLGIKFDTSASGEYKELGLPLGGRGDEELMEEQLEAVNEIFREKIAENRNLDEQEVEKIFEGKPYLGKDAKEAGLVDRLGGREEAIKIIKETLGAEEIEVHDYGEKMREESEGFMGKVIKKFFG